MRPGNGTAILGCQPDRLQNTKDVNTLQGVVKSYDPVTRDGLVVTDTADMVEYELAANALEGSVFRMLRPGQRVNLISTVNPRQSP